MSDLGRVAVIAGGLSNEREVSWRSGRRAEFALDEAGVDATLYDADETLLDRLAADHVDAAYIAVHGASGEDGSLQTALDLVGLPYVGSPPPSCHLAWDKVVAKVLVERAGLTTPAWVAISARSFRELSPAQIVRSVVSDLGLPVVVKPATSGSTLGMSLVAEAADLPAALVRCFTFGDVALIERFVEGRTVETVVVENAAGEPEALPPAEFANPSVSPFSFEARYSADLISIALPAPLSDAATAEVRTTAETVHRVLGLRDLSRTDVVVDAEGTPWFLEGAISPGLTETSVLPLAAAEVGRPLGTLLAELLVRAKERGAGR
ncbi:D-alanine--D-alanine ligase [Actinotalea sp. M2MS4P-6]|uniref:D-alanine--D-alanine ligase family protein n=1 Tax=Actinotalea sp. M2MS4P-6 TaxID=2983762 RepID=UPI0021E4EB0C|nr:D-alanine--D-alanine ligase [Actinotalea sp. M2MS4P-6]MCV2393991.1 D-alanine--D-alanine ligase [Actinotalea sp. M2MS4P-6]